jgi:hypothetical protein
VGEIKKPVGGNKGNNVGALGAVGAIGYVVFEAVKPYIKNFIDLIFTQLKKQINESKDGFITMPKLYKTNFPLDVDYVALKMKEHGFQVLTSKCMHPDIKFRNYINNQIIETDPKGGKKVQVGQYITLYYITQEVIDASQKIFEEKEKVKAELKEQKALMKQEHKEHRKEQISIIVDKAKDTVNNVVKKGKHKDE